MNTVFTRTASGVRNYSRFVGNAVVVYIEGRIPKGGGNDDQQDPVVGEPRDILFYKSLLSHFGNGRDFVFKCVGNKDNVLRHGELIRSGAINSAFVIVDRDYDGLHCNIIERPEIIYTYGYSWESDFWAVNLALQVLSDLTVNDKNAASDFVRYLRVVKKRIGYLSRLDSALRPLGKTILPKNGGSCGVALSSKGAWIVPVSEVKRIRAKFDSLKMEDVKLASRCYELTLEGPIERVIQGHLYEYIFVRSLLFAGKKCAALKGLRHAVLYNLAHSKFNLNVRTYLSSEAYEYYKDAFDRFLRVGNAGNHSRVLLQ